MIEIRGSEVNDFLRCRHKWSLYWKQEVRPKQQNQKLDFGTAFHKFLEVLYSTGDYNKAVFEMLELSSYEDDTEMLQEVAKNYMSVYNEHMERFEVVETELKFSIPVDSIINYAGTIDLLLKEKSTGNIYFLDHKTTSVIDKYVKQSALDRQISRYWWALQQLGYDVKGFVYNIILKDFPRLPSLLKNGKVSTAKNQNTTYELYRKFLLDNGFNLEEYSDILYYLQTFPKEYFKQIEVYRNRYELLASISEFKATVDDMISAKIYRNITKDCAWDCPYVDLCTIGISGGDITLLQKSLFTQQPYL